MDMVFIFRKHDVKHLQYLTIKKWYNIYMKNTYSHNNIQLILWFLKILIS